MPSPFSFCTSSCVLLLLRPPTRLFIELFALLLLLHHRHLFLLHLLSSSIYLSTNIHLTLPRNLVPFQAHTRRFFYSFFVFVFLFFFLFFLFAVYSSSSTSQGPFSRRSLVLTKSSSLSRSFSLPISHYRSFFLYIHIYILFQDFRENAHYWYALGIPPEFAIYIPNNNEIYEGFLVSLNIIIQLQLQFYV